MSERPAPEIEPQALDNVLRFLPLLETPEFRFGHWRYPEAQMPHFAPSSEALAFVQALYSAGLIYPFDWPSWLEEAERYMNEIEAVQTADLLTLCKLLTTHVRRDRFYEGHLNHVFRNGHLTAILKRLQGIRDELDATTHPKDNG